MPAIIAMPASDGSLWPLNQAPNEQKVGTDIVKALLDRYEKVVADVAALNALTGMFVGMRVYVTATNRVYAYLGSATGQGWNGEPKQFGDVSTTAAVTALPTPQNGDIVWCTGTTTLYRYVNGSWIIDSPIVAATPAALPTFGVFTGLMVYVTSLSQHASWNGSAWSYDSGWLTTGITWASTWGGTTAYGYGPLAYRKIGNRVYVNGAFTWTSSFVSPMFTLPTGYRPGRRHIAGLYSGSPVYGQVEFATDGTVSTATSTGQPFVVDTDFLVD